MADNRSPIAGEAPVLSRTPSAIRDVLSTIRYNGIALASICPQGGCCMNPAKPSKPIGTGSLRRSDSPEENAAWDKYFDYLLKSLRDPEPNARIRAAQILGDNRDPRAVEALGEALGGPDAGVRQNATIALGKIGSSALDALIAALQDPDRDLRQFAAKARGQIGDPRGIAGLVIALHDTQMDVRSQAAFALSRIGAPAVDALITALQDPDANVRANAARILGPIRDARAPPPLPRAAQSDRGTARVTGSLINVAEAARQAVEKIKSKK